jgi:class 3 adenylate cyclase
MHNKLLRKAFTDAGGIEIETKGDSFFVVFRSAGAGVTAAGAAQAVLASHEWPEGIALRVRMGLHTGEANVGSDGYVGYAVHQAARIGDAGHGGQVLISNTTAGLVRHDLPRELELRRSGRGHAARLRPSSASTNWPARAWRTSSRRCPCAS